MSESHHQWRHRVRTFVDESIAPHIEAWNADGTFPDELYAAAVQAGIFGMGFPAPLGGVPETDDLYHRIIFAEELHRLGSGVVFADLATHWIGLPPVIDLGEESLRESVVRPMLQGTQKISFAVTEPGGGSDVSRLVTNATLARDGWLVNGSKTLISGVMRADHVLTAVRTSDPEPGISLLLIDSELPGVSRKPVDGLSWYNASLGQIDFENVLVPQDRVIGELGRGFAALTRQFNIERFSGIAATLAMSRVCIADAIAFARERKAFGKRIIDHQAIRHKLIAMIREIRAAYGYLDNCVWRFEQGDVPIADLSLLKVHAVSTLENCSREAMQVLGGSAYTIRASRVERIYREARIFALGGGTEEVLSDFASRQLKF